MINFETIRQFEVNSLDTLSKEKKFVVGYKERHFEVGLGVAGLIEILKQSESLEEVRKKFSIQRKKTISPEEMEAILNHCIIPILDSEKKVQPKPFLVKYELVPAYMVQKISELLKILFKPFIAVLFMGLILTLHIVFYSSANTVFFFDEFGLLTFVGILALFILSSCFHELGHAAACRYFGVKHGGVGFGLYINFPVFYTDVSDIWKLTRNKRLIVNMAGTYFQLIFLIPVFIVYFINWDPILKYFIMTVNINFLITLNPFFKFDGYWIVSDILGVPNLRQRTKEVFTYYLRKIKKQTINQKPFLFSMKPGKKICMLLYSLVMNLFFVFVFCYLFPLFLYNFFTTFPNDITELVKRLALGETPSFDMLKRLLMQLLFFSFMLYALYKVIRNKIRQRQLRKKSQIEASVTS